MTYLEKLLISISSIEDPRLDRTKKHPLNSIIFSALCAALVGNDDWVGVSDYCDAQLEFLSDFVEFPNGAPSHDTIGRVMSLINPETFNDCFMDFTRALAGKVAGVVAIDGKTARGSCSSKSMKDALHMVSAWSSENSLVLGQVAVDQKSNEITAIPKLLALLDVKGCTVTLDAMGCQRAISEAIVGQGADYVIALKGNQGSLRGDVELLFEGMNSSPPSFESFSSYEQVSKEHGRIERRIVTTTEELGSLLDQHSWPGLRSVVRIESERTVNGQTTKECRYYISSRTACAESLASCVRSHWDVENKLHWVLDVTYSEDSSRIRTDHAPHNMNMIRKWALNVINANKGKLSVRRMQRQLGWKPNELRKILLTQI